MNLSTKTLLVPAAMILGPLSVLATLNPSSSFISPERAIPFYKSPTSTFASGQKNEKELSKARVRNEFQFSYLIDHENKSFWLTGDTFLRDLDLSQEVQHLETKNTYKVIEARGFWIYGERTTDQKKEWLPLSQLTPSTSDFGCAFNLISSQLHEKPEWKSNSKITLPPLTKLEVLELDSTWAKVKMKSNIDLVGFVDLNNLVMKADFASFVMTKDQKWHPVLHREMDELVIEKNKRLPIGKVAGWLTQPNLGIALRANPKYNIQLKTHLKIKRIEADTWIVSQLTGHGEVYWKPQLKNINLMEKQPSQSANITTEEILKREIQAVAFHPTNPHIGIISSQGIYYTIDGNKWTHLPQFQKENHPVAIGHNGEIIVGSLWSKNFGKSFEPYVKWENLTKLIESETQKTPRVIKIQSLEYKGPEKLKVTVDIGAEKISLLGNPESPTITSWQLLPYE
ncbi:MAG: hypothetical protein BroJett040_20810 [Oligoflexia bacterium]|nr:MAG: hypothetical protein BroJett040_20810 [Oligoflexia bacterium]